METTLFRKHYGSHQVWHFYPNCPDWPVTNFMELNELPHGALICVKCTTRKSQKLETDMPKLKRPLSSK